MIVIAEKLDTLKETVSTIDCTVTEIRDKQIENDVHMKNIIGPPSLEDRLRAYVESKKEHERANGQQALIQVQTILQLEQQNAKLQLEAQIKAVDVRSENTETERKANHESNGKRLSKLERNMYIAMGAVAALQFVLKFAFK
jgi:hypothetical protein